jgi:hypothetical protein
MRLDRCTAVVPQHETAIAVSIGGTSASLACSAHAVRTRAGRPPAWRRWESRGGLYEMFAATLAREIPGSCACRMIGNLSAPSINALLRSRKTLCNCCHD